MIRDLSKRVVTLILNGREIVGREPPVPDVPHDAYHLNWSVAEARNPEDLANGIFFSEGVMRQVLIDDDHLRSAEFVAVIEEATANQRKAHDLQVVRSNCGGQCFRLLIRRWRRSGSTVAKNILAFTHRNDIGQRNRLNGGNA